MSVVCARVDLSGAERWEPLEVQRPVHTGIWGHSGDTDTRDVLLWCVHAQAHKSDGPTPAA